MCYEANDIQRCLLIYWYVLGRIGNNSVPLNVHPCAGGPEAGAQEAIPEYSAAEERRDSTLWRSVAIGEQEHQVDMKCIEPYRRVVSHGGEHTLAHTWQRVELT